MKILQQFPRRPWLRVLLLLAVCWALAFLGPLSYLVLVAVPLALWRAWRQRARLALVLLLVLNPASGFFIAGVAAYVDGAPVLCLPNLPDLESYNPDSVNRCPRGVGSCLLQGSEWLTLHAFNAAVRLICYGFGPPALAYTGPYPTKHEALELMAKALLTPVDSFLQGRVLADGKMVKLRPAVASGLAGLVGLQDDATTPVHACIYQDRCVILRLSRRSAAAASAEDFATDILVLIDRSTQRPFAYYPIAGTTLPRVPPVTYLE